MTFMSTGPRLFALLALVAVVATGCAKKPKPAVTPSDTTPHGATGDTQSGGDTNAADASGDTGTHMTVALDDVYFDYDRFVLREDARETLNANAKQLLSDAALRLVLEGHCDERGTVEYNLALGEKRANTAREYLVRYGVDVARLQTVSFGEERPFDPGHDESAWSKNRRVHFVKQ